MALVALIATFTAIQVNGGSAGAATVSQTLNCGIGGTQTNELNVTAPATVDEGGTYTVVFAPTGSGTASGAEIKNITTNFTIPTGASYVAGSAALTGGSSNLGTKNVTVSGGNIAVSASGPIANGASFTASTLTFQLKATGAAGSVLRMRFRATAAYTLTAAGSFNVSCDASPQVNLTSTTIQAATTTTTSTTSPSSTTTTGGGSTTTTAPTTTTTAPPTITTQTWSPGTACGVEETVTAPANTISATVQAVGGNGGQSGSQASSGKASGGTGGQAFGTFAATGGQVFSAVVGCNGANGQSGAATSQTANGWAPGGTTGTGSIVLFQTGAGGGGGGAATGVCLGPDCIDGGNGAPLVVAGGGGGGGVSNCAGTSSGAGGAAGTGATGTGDSGFGPAGAKGANGSGGAGGGAGGVNTNQANGSGGNAPSTGPTDGLGVSVVGGAGGGGYAGGKQGQNANTGCKGAGGGGGGSSWVANSATNATFGAGSTAGVVITFTISTPATTTTTTSTTSTTTSTTAPTSTTSTTQPCTPDVAPFATPTAFVTQQYKDATGSAPTSGQLAEWVPGITSCTITADSATVALLPTDQTLDDARLVRLYLAYFKRPPDPSGFAYWQRQLDDGKGLINAAKRFAESSEFQRTYGSLSNSAFIDLVYQNVLDRAPDSTGKAFWLTRLDNKTKNRGDVMINFSESSENVRKRTSAVQVFRMHGTMMRRFPSKVEFFDLLDPVTAGGTLEGAAKSIRLSSAYAARF